MELIEAGIAAGLAAVLIASAAPKLRRPRSFVVTVQAYEVLPEPLAFAYARLLGPAELLIGLLLLTGAGVREAAVAGSFLLASFIVAITANPVRGRDLECGCFGARRSRRIGWGLALEDVGLLAACLVLALAGPGWHTEAPWSVFRLLGHGTGIQAAAVVACLATTAACQALLGRAGAGSRRWTHAVAKQ